MAANVVGQLEILLVAAALVYGVARASINYWFRTKARALRDLMKSDIDDKEQ